MTQRAKEMRELADGLNGCMRHLIQIASELRKTSREIVRIAAQADAPGEPCEQCSAIPPTEHHPDCMYYGDAPGDMDVATVEACANVADAVVTRAERLMESDPKSARQTLAAVANGAMECAASIRALASGTKP